MYNIYEHLISIPLYLSFLDNGRKRKKKKLTCSSANACSFSAKTCQTAFCTIQKHTTKHKTVARILWICATNETRILLKRTLLTDVLPKSSCHALLVARGTNTRRTIHCSVGTRRAIGIINICRTCIRITSTVFGCIAFGNSWATNGA